MFDFIIKSVIDADTNTKSKKFGYREGRECRIDINSIKEGLPLIVHYSDGGVFMTTAIQEIIECEYGFRIRTKNRIYQFDYLIKSRREHENPNNELFE